MIYSPLTKLAMNIAVTAHAGQFDKGGYPYIHHPLYLAEQMPDEISTAAALLHDVVEDTEYSFESLTEEGIPREVIEVLKLLTHDDAVPYLDYVQHICDSGCRPALLVKLADLKHNSDPSRLVTCDEHAQKRLKKYAKAIAMIEGALKP